MNNTQEEYMTQLEHNLEYLQATNDLLTLILKQYESMLTGYGTAYYAFIKGHVDELIKKQSELIKAAQDSRNYLMDASED